MKGCDWCISEMYPLRITVHYTEYVKNDVPKLLSKMYCCDSRDKLLYVSYLLPTPHITPSSLLPSNYLVHQPMYPVVTILHPPTSSKLYLNLPTSYSHPTSPYNSILPSHSLVHLHQPIYPVITILHPPTSSKLYLDLPT